MTRSVAEILAELQALQAEQKDLIEEQERAAQTSEGTIDWVARSQANQAKLDALKGVVAEVKAEADKLQNRHARRAAKRGPKGKPH